MVDTIIVSGGNIQRDFALGFLEKEIEKCGREYLLLIAADRGLDFLLDVGIYPDMAVGDFDSLSERGKKYLEEIENDSKIERDRKTEEDRKTEDGRKSESDRKTVKARKTEVIRLKPEKDDSDTQSALMYAKERGAVRVVILGATGSRLDHVMANFGLLLLAQNKGMQVTLVDQNNYISLVESGTVLIKEEQFGKYVSFFPMGGDVEGLTLEGFKYPLNQYHLRIMDSGLTVSNEIKSQQAKITYTKGNLLMMMSRD